MDQNPYVNEGLPATRDGLCDPALEVESRLAALSDLLDEWAPEGPEYLAYDLLATVGWLERVRGDLRDSVDPSDLMGSALRRVQAEGKDLAGRAAVVPDPDGWIEEAKALVDSYEEPIDPAERAGLACRLFDDLDDAELAAAVAGRLGIHDPELDQGLGRCRVWFARHADAFLSAGVYVQAVGQALRADLPRSDPELARTADKVVQLLRALEDMEAELTIRGVEPIEPEALWPLIERFASGQPLVEVDDNVREPEAGLVPIAGSYPFRAERVFSLPLYHLAAQGGEPETLPIACEWRSPDGRFLAGLYLFRAPASDQEGVTIAFTDPVGQPARELAGHPVRLGNRPALVEDLGPNVVARFTWGELRQLVGDLRLLVGPEQEEWEAEVDDS